MSEGRKHGDRNSFVVLHSAFALTGVLHAINGALLPSISSAFQLTDSQSGSLALFYFLGTSLGAILCTEHYVRLMPIGFLIVTASSFGIASAGFAFLPLIFFVHGIGVGIPMTAVSMYAGRRFGDQSAAPLTLLNFSWSLGAFFSPLFASRILVHREYDTAYQILGIAAAVAAVACWLAVEDAHPIPIVKDIVSQTIRIRWVALFALLTFLEVGIENTTATWLATYSLRSSHAGSASAAAASSLYWCGFLASRGLTSLLLLRVAPMRVLRLALLVAFAAAMLLLGLPAAPSRNAAMILLGAALAPIFPVLLARFFAGAYNPSDSRWLLATCGFGGSVLPWFTGWVSAGSHSLRIGLGTVPAALMIMLCIIPVVARKQQQSAA